MILVLFCAGGNVRAAGVSSQTANAKKVTFKAKVLIEDKVWNTSNDHDKNLQDRTYNDTYYYPWQGDDQAQVTRVVFTDLTQDQQRYIEDYGISIDCDPVTDVSSAVIDMNFIGRRPVTITWTKAPSLAISRQEQAEADGYTFTLTLEDPVCNVLDTGEEGITEEEYASYYEKAKKACQIILKCCQDKNAFGDKDNPAFLDVDVWSVLTAARCGYVPYGDEGYFSRWYENAAAYLSEQGTSLKNWKTTDLAKIALAIEAIGRDPRDVGGVNLLEYIGLRSGSETYTNEYAIHAIKAGLYETESFPESDMEAWVHDRARTLKRVKDASLKNADNSMGWQPLIYWYGKEGFEDVTEAIDQAEVRLPLVAQRGTGAFCTEHFETGCATYGNNPWNNAQAVIFASVADINILDPASGYTKNGNNVLDAMLFHVGLEEEAMYGLTYDPPQIARALNAFVRMYERNILHMDTKHFWDFTDAGDREEQIPVEQAAKLINAIPEPAGMTLQDKAAVEEARKAYDALSKDQKARLGSDFADKLTQAEERIAALEKEAEDQKEAEGTTKKETDTKKETTTKKSSGKFVLKKGKTFASGKYRFKVTKVSGKKGEATLTGCKNKKLKKITVPATVKYKGYTLKVTAVGPKALKGYKKLTALTIGKNVKTIGKAAFAGCLKLKKIIVKSTLLKKVGAGALKGIHKKAVIKVPKKKKKAYKKLFKGKGQKKTVKIR